MQSFFRQLVDLTFIQLTNWRWSWRSTLLTSLILPVMSTLAFGAFATNSSSETLGYIITGNMVMSLLFGTVGKVSSNFAYMRFAGMLDYLATLPIYRVALILASVVAFLALSLPPAILTLVLSALIFHVPMVISPWIVVVIPLISSALCGLGALIGILSRTPDEVTTLSTLTTLVMMMLGPVLLPVDRLPGIVQVAGMVSPATYAASALRQVVLGTPDRFPLGLDLAALVLLMAGLLWIVGQRLDWRQS